MSRAALAALVLILLCDGLIALVDPGLLALAPIDEAAHLATVFVVLAALGWGIGVPLAVALAAGVAIDLDHLPGIVQAGLELGDQRPVTHSVLVPLAVAAVGLVLPERARVIALAAAAGLALHLFRDAATGPGITAAPFGPGSLALPYAVYVGVLVAAVVLAWRSGSRSR